MDGSWCFGEAQGALDHVELKLSKWDWFYVVFGTMVSYGAVVADIVVAFHYSIGSNTWWVLNTLLAVFAPGVFMCMAQHFSNYQEPDDEHHYRQREMNLAPGERPPLKRRRRMYFQRWVQYYVLNVLQLRMLHEAYNSVRWKFVTGAYMDTRSIQVAFQSFPQLLVQSWVIFHLWGSETPFGNWKPTFVSFGFAAACICLLPNHSPCFEDNYHLVTLGTGKDGDDGDDVSKSSLTDNRSVIDDELSSYTDSLRSVEMKNRRSAVQIPSLGALQQHNDQGGDEKQQQLASMRSLSGFSSASHESSY